jgi:penicillin amidase
MDDRLRRAAHGALATVGAAVALVSSAGGDEPGIPTERLAVSGLSAPAEILIDRWGVPHLYAGELYDAFFLQGFNAARDRLWQLDLWKRRGDGTLSEVFGPAFVEKDRAARLFLFRGDMRAEWLAYASDTKRIVEAFVAGVNAWIEITRRDPERLPPEFRMLDYEPALWTPETVVRIRSHGLLWNAAREASRARFIRRHGLEALKHREWFEPAHELALPDGLDLRHFPDDVLKVYGLARRGVKLDRDAEGGLVLAAAPLEPALRSASNNWAIAPSRSATGRPMLANDPHRALSVPSLRYIAHLSAPGLDVIGAGEPSLPGISIGHNRRIAFGLTIFFIDQEDLYVYRTRWRKPSQYRYRDRWEPMRIVTESIPVRGGAPVEVTLKYTRHGPVLHEDPKHRTAIALRAAWLEPGMAPYLGSIEYMRAQNWDEFLAAMNRWGLPPENQVYADTKGHIGWKPGGLAPVRPNWDGLLPVPGDGRYEWAGYLDGDQLPVEADPVRGWVASANQMNLPEGYLHPVGFEWIMSYRYQRIREVLGSGGKFTRRDMVALQSDTRSVTARRVLALLAGLQSSNPKLQAALEKLRGWDGRLDATSEAAALYQVWVYRHLAPAVIASQVDDPALRQAILDEGDLYDVFEGGSVEAWLSRLEDPDAWGRGDALAARNAVLFSSLASAVESTEVLLGEDWSTWRWGRLHHATLRHPLSAIADDATEFDVGPASRGGSGETVNSTAYSLGDFVQRYGASFRMVLDVGDWDRSIAMNTPGQSGDPGSPHYRDLFEDWARDESFPLLFSRERVEAAATRRILLRPSQP